LKQIIVVLERTEIEIAVTIAARIAAWKAARKAARRAARRAGPGNRTRVEGQTLRDKRAERPKPDEKAHNAQYQ
jgi:hypothetical protein